MRLKRHFASYNWDWYPEGLMMAGVICVIAGVYYPQQLVNMILLAIVLAGSGGGWKYWRSLYVASEKEFDQIAEADYAGIQHYALQRFELTPADLRDSEPCKFRRAPPLVPMPLVSHVENESRTGSDEKVRRSPMEYLVINFGQTQLFFYECVWDLTSGAVVRETTHEFAYRDIIAVELTHLKETIHINLTTRALLPAWEKQGIKPVNKRLQVPTEETVSLRLAQHGTTGIATTAVPPPAPPTFASASAATSTSISEPWQLFKWRRSTAGVPSGEGNKHFATAQRLQKLVRDFKQPPPKAAQTAPVAAPAPKALPTIRHMRRTSSSS
jgi:hypothetical protein